MSRSAFLAGARAVLPLLLGVVPFGLLFGALATHLGFGLPAVVGLSLFLFAGAAQFVFVQLAAAGVAWSVVVVACVILNLRHLLYSASLAPLLARLGAPGRMLLAYFITDEAYAITIRNASGSDAPQHAYFFGAGATLWASWQVSTVAGAVLGASLPPSPLYAFTLPATFVAIVAPSLRDRAAIVSAAAAAGLAIATARLPLGTGLVLASAIGILIGAALERRDEG